MKGSPVIYNEWDVNPFAEIKKERVFIKTESGSDRFFDTYALVNQDTQAIYGVVSEDYELIHNREVNQIFEDAFTDIEVVEIHDHLDIGARKWRRNFIVSPEQFGWNIGNNSDITGLMLQVFNAYTGKNSYGYALMGYRWICKNGQIMGKKPIFSSTFTHMTNALSQIRESFPRKLLAFEENVLLWKNWSEMRFTMHDMLKFADSLDYLSPKGKERILGTYELTMNREHHDETKWGAYNTLTYMATHNPTTRKEQASPVFSHSASVLTRLVNDFYEI